MVQTIIDPIKDKEVLMNNITQLHPITNNNEYETRSKPEVFSDESSLYFPVWERPCYFKGTDNFYEDPSHKHIVREWSGYPHSLGVVGKNYKVLHTKDVCEGVEDTFMEVMSDEELDNVRRTDSISYLGATTIRNYIFPNISADIGSRHSDIAFRTIIINGYDGSSSFKFYHGAIDFFCTNGMVTGSYDMIVKRHTSGLTVPKLTDRLRASVDIFYKQAEQWSHWVGKEISDEEAEKCFEAMPNVSERRVQQLMRQFRIECHTHGRTVWALYSAATFYSSTDSGEFSIRETESDHKASTLMNREQQVRSWISSDEFMEIAA
tara:strand:+ start:817 stop:1779 length:963 start_codon:yes stop_codon:yes gene_type:complete